MKTDKNTVIGFVLLFVLFGLYFWYNNSEQVKAAKATAEKKRIEDSIAAANAPKQKIDTAFYKADSTKRDSLQKLALGGGFTSAATGTEQLATVENDLVKVTFTNKGGMVKFVELKKYKSFDGKNVVLGSKDDDISYSINTGSRSAQTSQLFFTPSEVSNGADGNKVINYTIKDSAGKSITHQFTIKPNSYSVDWNVMMNGADQLLTQQTLNFHWKVSPQQHEKYASYEKQVSNVCFYTDGDFDYISSKSSKKFEAPVKWVSAVQQFFNSTLMVGNGFTGGEVNWARTADSVNQTLANVEGTFQMKVNGAQQNLPFKLFYGPNEYEVLKQQGEEMDKIVNLGRDIYSFVRPINKYVIMPVFNFFASFISQLGWAILLLTLFIRLITSPLVYSSYLSGAKMKALRPELDTLKKKFGDDQQGFAMEQMKLFREAGVNPLGGCLPALLQIPIFFSLYSFFNSNIALRGQSFLWASDLSRYDVLVNLPFDWLLGGHISLFTLTAVITSFLISIYNMSMTPQQDNPVMKYMPYVFPFILLFIFNNLPSALTWYYTVSNIITLGLQFVIQNYIINHDKILAQIDQKRKAPKKKSKWVEIMEQQKQLQQDKQKNQNKK